MTSPRDRIPATLAAMDVARALMRGAGYGPHEAAFIASRLFGLNERQTDQLMTMLGLGPSEEGE